jgi:putative peptidoglycan lipid II flippase
MSRIFRISLLLAFFFAIEKILGFVRQLAVARQFGLSPELDAFNAANNLPDLIFALISGGALAVAFIPVLSEYLQKDGRPAAWDLFSRVANLVFLTTAGISALIAIFAPQLIHWNLGIAPGFNTEQQALVANLMRLNLVATLLFSLSGLVIAGLQANQHFLLPALAPAMYDIGGLFGVFVFAPQKGYVFGPIHLPAFGMGIYGLVYGVILGSLLFLLVQLPGLLRYGFRWTPAVSLRHPGVNHVLALMLPRIATMFFIQLVFVAQDNFASRLTAGAVSSLVYGWLIMQVPETLIGTAVGTALLPTLSEHIARKERTQFHNALNRSVRVLVAITLPIAVLLAIVIRPVVGVFNFDAAGTELVVWTARAYLLGLMGHSLLEVAARSFYAQQDARTPLYTSIGMSFGFILLAIVFSPRLGAPGIALSNSIAFTGEALFMLLLLNRQFQGLLRVSRTSLRVLGGSLIAGLVAYAVLNQWLMPTSLLLAPGLFTGLLLSTAALILGAGIALPFIWPEVKLLIKL